MSMEILRAALERYGVRVEGSVGATDRVESHDDNDVVAGGSRERHLRPRGRTAVDATPIA
jgi:hypothetical protein